MKILYIAGPYRSNTPEGIFANIAAAEAVASEIWRLGHAALCPHKNSGGLDGHVPDETFLEGDLLMLERCDGIVLLPRWKCSQGALGELKLARDIGLTVFHWPADKAAIAAWGRATG